MSNVSSLSGKFVLAAAGVDPRNAYIELINPNSGVTLTLSTRGRASSIPGMVMPLAGVIVTFKPAVSEEIKTAPAPAEMATDGGAEPERVECIPAVPDWMVQQARGRLAWRRFHEARDAIVKSFGPWIIQPGGIRDAVKAKTEELTRLYGPEGDCDPRNGSEELATRAEMVAAARPFP